MLVFEKTQRTSTSDDVADAYSDVPQRLLRLKVLSRPLLKGAAASAAALVLANCSAPQQQGSKIDPKYGVSPSPRVVSSGPIPKGGGRDHVGKPYTIAGKVYHPREDTNYSRVGLASWYGDAFHGRKTANGEVFDKLSIAAAHPTLPLPSYVRVTNLTNSKSMVVRVNDRGPFHGNRLIDVSSRTAEALGFKRAGTARVQVDYLGRAGLAGSDDRKLMATLTDQGPARLPGSTAPVMVARAEPAKPQALAFNPRQEPPPAAPRIERVAYAAPVATPASAAAAVQSFATAPVPSQGRVVTNIPLPPERPFDLGGTTRGTPSVPQRQAANQERRPTKAAALFYAETQSMPNAFRASSGLIETNTQRFVSFKSSSLD
ncbi:MULTISPECIES: septal ring lytic transglycosylase RlpA family protein [unclassified Chelatococcus]|uniref:septal ring lytic transglycosylase RlpA family protein n=1 Tax=unclassified Chelatococcus TaxID=2638111 RepID=UPI001BCE919D|nr:MULTISPECIES: septal ring lytic transglycosylase RlpA family protein [unclassified Chelatococcus]MBS7699249.1 septal ring lytic transglycosylase RlpA family protein [Chelatococcus sp. YT9]MBX3557619.1 septal ring lytic transglycosylase RlpA family protein [Chelatococcus sp.]